MNSKLYRTFPLLNWMRTGPEDELTREDIFDVLSNDRRRCMLNYLKSRDDEWIPFGDIVDHVTSWETGVPIAEIDADARKTIYTSLRQFHLPRLKDAGIVEYSQSRSRARLTPAAREVQMYIEYVPSNDIPWHQYYLGVAGIVSSLATVTWLDIYPFGELGWSILMGLIVAILGISAFVHTKYARENRLGTDTLYSGAGP